ncbi:hypothetical protein Gogos_000760, partial [Gossypium gossypioides]|nr:hypothetical protein [Gossypium gossypioides]
MVSIEMERVNVLTSVPIDLLEVLDSDKASIAFDCISVVIMGCATRPGSAWPDGSPEKLEGSGKNIGPKYGFGQKRGPFRKPTGPQ